MEKKKVSVILTSYNKEKYINQAIESVLTQSYQDFELIIVDDGSTDNSRQIIEALSADDQRIKTFYFEKNKGIPSAHNFAISQAQGEYCAVIDCDDFWEKDKLQKQVEFLEKNKEYGACFTWISVVDENELPVPSELCENRDIMWNSQNHTQGEWLKLFFTEGCKLGNPSMMIKTSVFENIGYYSYGLKQLQDYELFIRILKYCNVYVINERLVNYRWFCGAEKNTSNANLENTNRTNFEYYLVCKKFFDNMSNEIFMDGFSKFINNEDYNREEVIEYKKIILYLNYFLLSEAGKVVAYEKIYDYMNNKICQVSIDEYLGMTSSQFAQGLSAPLIMDANRYMPIEQDKYIKEMKEKLKKEQGELNRTLIYLQELTKSNKDIEVVKEEQERYIKELENNLKKASQEIEKKKNYIEILENNSKKTSEQIEKYKNYIEKLESSIKEINQEIKNQKSYIEELEESLKRVSKEVENQRNYIEELENKNIEINKLYEMSRDYSKQLEARIQEKEKGQNHER
ncbi:glycosyltransferase family 2 protein [Kineothrix sp. MB12-C1]|uniref:glycosyltransferase family 2 protein n=1 Tax=Kineothrix sp. MB12-C1 TaxID=3070215 RepID=UPI0027D2B633|nr:glycosyltransferase [Kineothrix sp. MB12-C1]WMC91705.1 glycosyltransferase [Kineothrix sp. MB12-C1]